MSDSVRPHRQKPNRLLCPWDSPGKNTGVGCHFLLQCMKVKSESEVAQSCPTPSDPMDCSLPGSSIHGTLQARVLGWVAIAFPSPCTYLYCKNHFVTVCFYDFTMFFCCCSENVCCLKERVRSLGLSLPWGVRPMRKYCVSACIGVDCLASLERTGLPWAHSLFHMNRSWRN